MCSALLLYFCHLFPLGVFAAIYHPVGTAMIVENATQRGRTMAFNGVCGNLGIALAAGITAVLTAALSWRGAFFVPGVICVATGAAYVWFIPDEGRHKAARSSAPFASAASFMSVLPGRYSRLAPISRSSSTLPLPR